MICCIYLDQKTPTRVPSTLERIGGDPVQSRSEMPLTKYALQVIFEL